MITDVHITLCAIEKIFLESTSADDVVIDLINDECPWMSSSANKVTGGVFFTASDLDNVATVLRGKMSGCADNRKKEIGLKLLKRLSLLRHVDWAADPNGKQTLIHEPLKRSNERLEATQFLTGDLSDPDSRIQPIDVGVIGFVDDLHECQYFEKQPDANAFSKLAAYFKRLTIYDPHLFNWNSRQRDFWFGDGESHSGVMQAMFREDPFCSSQYKPAVLAIHSLLPSNVLRLIDDKPREEQLGELERYFFDTSGQIGHETKKLMRPVARGVDPRPLVGEVQFWIHGRAESGGRGTCLEDHLSRFLLAEHPKVTIAGCVEPRAGYNLGHVLGEVGWNTRELSRLTDMDFDEAKKDLLDSIKATNFDTSIRVKPCGWKISFVGDRVATCRIDEEPPELVL